MESERVATLHQSDTVAPFPTAVCGVRMQRAYGSEWLEMRDKKSGNSFIIYPFLCCPFIAPFPLRMTGLILCFMHGYPQREMFSGYSGYTKYVPQLTAHSCSHENRAVVGRISFSGGFLASLISGSRKWIDDGE